MSVHAFKLDLFRFHSSYAQFNHRAYPGQADKQFTSTSQGSYLVTSVYDKEVVQWP